MLKPILVDGAVKAADQHSHAFIANGRLFVSGPVLADPITKIGPDGLAARVRRMIRNLLTILHGDVGDLIDIGKVNAHLSGAIRFQKHNAADRNEFFTDSLQARTNVGSQVVWTPVEIDCATVLLGS
jgi:enamine deaminase RidA (YjgF/YER057c/UK114 family)